MMAILSAEQRDLLLQLMEGLGDDPPWRPFLRNLAIQTGADAAILVLNDGVHVVAPTDGIALRTPETLILRSPATLRPGRVYALDELLAFDDPALLARQRAALAAISVRDGRWMRAVAGDAGDVLIVLVRGRDGFSSMTAPTLSALAPFLAAALRLRAGTKALQGQAAMARAALERLGVGQVRFDSAGRVIMADPLAEATLTFVAEPGGTRRLELLPDVARSLENHCAELTIGDPPRVLMVEERRGLTLLLRGDGEGVVGTLRLDRHALPIGAIGTIAALHGLSQREAELAHALTIGESIAEAGARLGLSLETARNYSKRIYAKTGARGQADLVRIVLSGLAPFS